jgi:hypothetical protein
MYGGEGAMLFFFFNIFGVVDVVLADEYSCTGKFSRTANL